ncbi:MAG: hypothetical protein KJ042_16355, partial [Deltaproteobacteria bacterium]|nr:hypothetical protein [Deltaproteobacteria bacterium]
MSPNAPTVDPALAIFRVLRLYGFEFTADLAGAMASVSPSGRRAARVDVEPATLRVRGFVSPANDPMVLADLAVMGADLARAAAGAPGVVHLYPLRPDGDGDVDESELELFDETRRHLDDVHQDHEVDLSGIAAKSEGSSVGIARAEIAARGEHGVNVSLRIEPEAAALSIRAEVTGIESVEIAAEPGGGPRPWLAWLPTDGKGRRVGFQLARRFRADGVECRVAAGDDVVDAMFAWADRGGARWSVMLGGNERL